MRRLHAAAAGDDVEAAVAPFALTALAVALATIRVTHADLSGAQSAPMAVPAASQAKRSGRRNSLRRWYPGKAADGRCRPTNATTKKTP